jgi:hypothetical protein
MATKNNPGQYDCYQNAAPDEPMFVLLGRDRHAPVLVRLWALLRDAEGEVPAKVQEAMTCFVAMTAWLTKTGKQAVTIEELLSVIYCGRKDGEVVWPS